jgi:hypothetical protein
MTLLTCVSARGDALIPMIISQAPIRGLRQDEDETVGQGNPAHIDEELFHEYLVSVFIPYVINLRNDVRSSGEIAVWLMDSALPHLRERRLKLLGANRVLSVAFPDSAKNVIQSLGPVSSGVLKQPKARRKREFYDRSVNDHVTKLVQVYWQTALRKRFADLFRRQS